MRTNFVQGPGGQVTELAQFPFKHQVESGRGNLDESLFLMLSNSDPEL